ncbi:MULTISPECIES: flagellar basal body rod protein FlgB [unclassified Bacillus (in: firmicutes)]|uniref:flagellar basal body rod protein FlgB n=1 Tax=unclassified Bacillus (in: firmicutes) TaxID=185979 RepID=UPI003D24626B
MIEESGSMLDFVSNVNRYMDYLVTKRNTVSNNISNANTPGFKAQDVDFSEQLANSNGLYKKNELDLQKSSPLYQTNPVHLPLSNETNTYAKIRTNTLSNKEDGNSVDVTKEMVDLVKTNQLYGISINAINTQYTIDQAARGR